MIEGEIAGEGFFIAYPQFAEAVEPAMRNRNDPASGLVVWIRLLLKIFLFTPFYVRDIAMRQDRCHCFSPGESRVGTQVL